jgi:pyrimidine operon attenuation protein/uracil phosphoribosyltransferase
MTTEILERNRSLKNLVIVGIRTRGIYIGKRISELIRDLEKVDVPVGALDITPYRDDMTNTGEPAMVEKTEIDFSIAKRDVLLVDDVLNTGRTIRAAMEGLFDLGRPQTIQLLVLIDRGHRELPIRADYVGKVLPTSKRELVRLSSSRSTEATKSSSPSRPSRRGSGGRKEKKLKLLIRNGRVIDPSSGTDETQDVLIVDGKIASVEARIEGEGMPVVDASRLVVAPGFIDMHAHVREPGQEKKEDIGSASRAAAKGGFTTICAMPNTNPVNDSRRVTEYIIAESRKRAIVSILPIAAITRGLAGEELTDMAGLSASGAVGFSDDGRGVQNSRIMSQALEQARRLEALVIDHCEDSYLSQGGLMHEGPTSRRLGLPGIPAVAEDVMVSRDIILAGATGACLHIAHLSTRGALDLVREAKRKRSRSRPRSPAPSLLADTALKDLDPTQGQSASGESRT